MTGAAIIGRVVSVGAGSIVIDRIDPLIGPADAARTAHIVRGNATAASPRPSPLQLFASTSDPCGQGGRGRITLPLPLGSRLTTAGLPLTGDVVVLGVQVGHGHNPCGSDAPVRGIDLTKQKEEKEKKLNEELSRVQGCAAVASTPQSLADFPMIPSSPAAGAESGTTADEGSAGFLGVNLERRLTAYCDTEDDECPAQITIDARLAVGGGAEWGWRFHPVLDESKTGVEVHPVPSTTSVLGQSKETFHLRLGVGIEYQLVLTDCAGTFAGEKSSLGLLFDDTSEETAPLHGETVRLVPEGVNECRTLAEPESPLPALELGSLDYCTSPTLEGVAFDASLERGTGAAGGPGSPPAAGQNAVLPAEGSEASIPVSFETAETVQPAAGATALAGFSYRPTLGIVDQLCVKPPEALTGPPLVGQPARCAEVAPDRSTRITLPDGRWEPESIPLTATGATTPAVDRVPDPCALLTDADIQGVIGLSLDKVQRQLGNHRCERWGSFNGAPYPITYNCYVSVEDGVVGDTPQSILSRIPLEQNAHQVDGIGDAAYVAGIDQGSRFVEYIRGHTQVDVSAQPCILVPSSKNPTTIAPSAEQMIALARIVDRHFVDTSTPEMPAYSPEPSPTASAPVPGGATIVP